MLRGLVLRVLDLGYGLGFVLPKPVTLKRFLQGLFSGRLRMFLCFVIGRDASRTMGVSMWDRCKARIGWLS